MLCDFDDHQTRDKLLEVAYLFFCLHDSPGVYWSVANIYNRHMARDGKLMDTQTLIALLIVFLSAIVVASRMKESMLGWFSGDSAKSSCGSCTGCAAKNSDALVQIQPFVRRSKK